MRRQRSPLRSIIRYDQCAGTFRADCFGCSRIEFCGTAPADNITS
jgi:hypothetical protein